MTAAITTALPYRVDGVEYFSALAHLPDAVWLESGGQGVDIFSAMPVAVVAADSADPLHGEIAQRLATPVAAPYFAGGWIGYLSYGARNGAFGLAAATTRLPAHARFGYYDWALVQDHRTRTALLLNQPDCPPERLEQVRAALAGAPADTGYWVSAFARDQSPETYFSACARVAAHIAAGDAYQVNYSQRFSAAFAGSTAAAYLAMRAAVPSPHGAYLALPNSGAILSLSPERFIRIEGDRALTEPIKGTAPRAATPEQDRANAEALLRSAKNRAENLMIVDLLRNDFNRNCQPGSVVVPELFALKSFANVHHLVSTVEGRLASGVDHYRFICDAFPGGSITGAPKRRAMQIIESLEPHPREIYCGAIGYLGQHGGSDFNIAIRTFQVSDGRIYGWGGSGLVADSEPQQEFEETLTKISRFCEALEAGSSARLS